MLLAGALRACTGAAVTLRHAAAAAGSLGGSGACALMEALSAPHPHPHPWHHRSASSLTPAGPSAASPAPASDPPLPLVLRRAGDEALSPHPPTTGTSPLTVRYPFPIDYYKDREAVVYSLDERPLGLAHLPGAAFNVPVRLDILHRVVRYWRAKWQQGTHKAKRRSEVRGGGRKPRPQKKTGRARAGSIRSPLWKGGGVAFGPKPRSHAHALPRATRLLGMRCALSARINEGRFFVVDDLITIHAPPPEAASSSSAIPAAATASPSSSAGSELQLSTAGTASLRSNSRTRAIGSSNGTSGSSGSGGSSHSIRTYSELKSRLARLTGGSVGSTWLLVDSGEAGPDGGARLRKQLKCSVVMEVLSPQQLTVYHVLRYQRLVVTRGALAALGEALTAPHRVRKPVKHAWWAGRRAAVEAAVAELNEAAERG